MTSTRRAVFEFGEFRLDPVERLLARASHQIDLPPKAFDVLVLLVERHGRLIRKEDFLQTLWHDTFVEEGTLKRHVSALRKALGDNGETAAYIETLPKAGYRFVSSVRVIQTDAVVGTSPLPPRDIHQAPAEQPVEPPEIPVSLPADVHASRTSLASRRTTVAFAIAGVMVLGLTSFAMFRARDAVVPNPDAGAREYPKRLTNHIGWDGQPDWSPDGQRIAFASVREGKADIYVMSANGGTATNLTNNPATDTSPAWSPDGSMIAFESDRAVGIGIYIMNADGGNPRRIVPNGGRPAWAPDGKRLVFMSGTGAGFEIHVVNTDATGLTQVTHNNLFDADPHWSPDGRTIAFTRAAEHDDLEIFVMDADGANERRLTFSPGYDGVPIYSPDGTRIAFHSGRGSGTEVYVMAADGSGASAITHNGKTNGEASWSPDGAKLTFFSTRDGNAEIYAVEAIPETARRCTSSIANDSSPSWSADGARLVFSSNRDGLSGLYEASCGEPPVKIDVGNDSAYLPVWSPRGNTLAFASDHDGQSHLYLRAGRRVRSLTQGHYQWARGTIAWSPDNTQVALATVVNGAGSIVILDSAGRYVRGIAHGPRITRDVAWSPDGSRIAFSARPHEEGSYNFEIYVIAADGSNERRLTRHSAYDVQPTWSPDSHRLAFISERSGDSDVYLMYADGSGLERLTYTPWAEQTPAWSRDGRRLALASSPLGNVDIYVYDLTSLLNGPAQSSAQ